MRLIFLALPVVIALPGAPSEYASSHSCDACHPGIAARYWKSAMGNSFARADATNSVPGSFVHGKSNRLYEVRRRDDAWFQYRLPLLRPAYPVERRMTHVVGSGRHARTYLHLAANGEWTQLPLTWYAELNSWAMSPGYDRTRHYDFSRTVDPACLQCHAAPPATADPEPRGAIDCQACHGPGQKHIDAVAAGLPLPSIRGSIVNPKSLSAPLQRDVCFQCHWQSTSQPLPHALPKKGRTLSSFRPGTPLSDTLVQFEPDGANSTLEINSHGFRLAQSACYQKSGNALTCTTCHDPHGAIASRVARRDACLGCHQAHSQKEREDCGGCHMPRRQTSDVIHVSMTDHRVARHGVAASPRLTTEPEEDPILRPRLSFPSTLSAAEQDYYLGLAMSLRSATRVEGAARIRRSGFPAPPARISAGAIALQKATAALGKGDSKGAKPLLQEATQYSETATDAWNNLAYLYLNAGDRTSARSCLERALSLTPTHADALNNLGRLRASEGDLDGALEAVDAALASDPSFAAARTNRTRILNVFGSRR
jgi:hypothetical protein